LQVRHKTFQQRGFTASGITLEDENLFITLQEIIQFLQRIALIISKDKMLEIVKEIHEISFLKINKK
jgi:hypothetical protein